MAQPLQLGLGQRDARKEVGLVCLSLLGDVRRDAQYLASELRSCALVEGRKANECLLAGPHVIDVLWCDFCLDHERVSFGHDQHDRLSGVDHAPDGVDRQLMDDPALRRADIDALQLVLGRNTTFHKLGVFCLNLAQLLHHLGAHVVINLDNLQLGLGDLAPSLGDSRDQLAPLAFDAGGVALKA